MGMFDWINYEMKCPTCGEMLNSFQSKDNVCQLEHLEFWEVNNFYDYCDNCETWVEFHRAKGIEGYKMTVEVGGG